MSTSPQGKRIWKMSAYPKRMTPVPSRVRTPLPTNRTAPHRLMCVVECGQGSSSTHIILRNALLEPTLVAVVPYTCSGRVSYALELEPEDFQMRLPKAG